MSNLRPFNPLKYTFGYANGFIFLIGLMIYIYLLIVDYLDNEKHSTEEKVWIYLFLCILIIGFIVSYYSITCSIEELNIQMKDKNVSLQNFGIKTIKTIKKQIT